jgi:prohead serine protease
MRSNTMNIHPRGLAADTIQNRFDGVAPRPKSYDAQTRSVDAVISMGTAVKRFYGTEKLRVAPDAVDLSRMTSSGIPLLDSHQKIGIDNHLGRITRTWFSGGALWGKLVFNDTERGRQAEGMVARGEIAGISAGYRVDEWQITDGDGRVIDPDKERINLDDDLTFTATRWQLLEASLVSVPADAASSIRSLSSGIGSRAAIDARARMAARQRMFDRMRQT